MDSTDFSILIGRLERDADEWPQLYTARLAAIAALGYACPALVAIGVLATWFSFLYSLAFDDQPSGWALLGCIAGTATLLAMFRALWVRIDEPNELQITPQDAPELFALIGAAQKLNDISLDSVRVHGEFDAGIRQIPRWSVFGGCRNHLQIGIPMLAALSVDEFAAVLAHEMGHLSSRHGWFSPWIYRQRTTWDALRPKFEEPANAFDRVLGRFYGWYIAYFHAYSFVLARNHEYAADDAAAFVTNAQIVGQALTKRELVGRFLAEVFWARLFAQIEKLPEAPQRPYTLMQRAFNLAQKEWARPDWLAQSLARYAAEGDTHPSLAERLSALDVKPAVPAHDAESSALSLLGPIASDLIGHCDEVWRAAHAAKWRNRHRELKEARWKIAEYEQYDDSALSPEDLWAKANLLLNVNRDADAIQTLQLQVARPGSHPKAHLLLGQLLLDHTEERGLQHLLMAAGQDAALASTAGEIGYSYLVKRGRKREALRFWQQIDPPVED